MNVWSVAEGMKAKCGFVQSFGYGIQSVADLARQIEVVWASGA